MKRFQFVLLTVSLLALIIGLFGQGCKPSQYLGSLKLKTSSNTSETTNDSDIDSSTDRSNSNRSAGNGGTYDGKLLGLHFEAGFTCEGKSSPKSLIERDQGKWYYTENQPSKCQFINKKPIPESDVDLKLSFNYAIYAKNRYYLKPYLNESISLCDVENQLRIPYAKGDGSPMNPFIICSPQQLYNLSKNSSDWSLEFALGDDLDVGDLADNSLTPIGNELTPFNGKFSGRGFAIYNHTYKSQNENNVGLFGRISKGRVEALFLVNSNIIGKDSVGSLVGVVDDLSTSGSAISIISTCFSIAGSVGGNSRIGGLVGTLNKSITAFSASDSSIIYGFSNIGGLIGESNGGSVIIKSFTFSVISGVKNIGGLIGSINLTGRSTVSLSFTESRVYGSESVGGFIGSVNSGDVFDSYAKSIVTIRSSETNQRGGFSTFIGSSGISAWVYKVYSSGRLIASAESLTLPSGGIIGHSLAPSNIYLSYFSDPIKGNTGIQVSDEELTHRSTFSVGWGFDTIWSINEGISPPMLN